MPAFDRMPSLPLFEVTDFVELVCAYRGVNPSFARQHAAPNINPPCTDCGVLELRRVNRSAFEAAANLGARQLQDELEFGRGQFGDGPLVHFNDTQTADFTTMGTLAEVEEAEGETLRVGVCDLQPMRHPPLLIAALLAGPTASECIDVLSVVGRFNVIGCDENSAGSAEADDTRCAGDVVLGLLPTLLERGYFGNVRFVCLTYHRNWSHRGLDVAIDAGATHEVGDLFLANPPAALASRLRGLWVSQSYSDFATGTSTRLQMLSRLYPNLRYLAHGPPLKYPVATDDDDPFDPTVHFQQLVALNVIADASLPRPLSTIMIPLLSSVMKLPRLTHLGL